MNGQVNRAVRARIDDAFWNPLLSTLRNVTLPDTLMKLERDKALVNYEHVIAGGGEHYCCPWHDGLLLETIRGASDYMLAGRDAALEERIDGYIDRIERAQAAAGGGYLSTYTLLERPHQRYGENGGSILWQHDLYNNGALFEAAAHYYRATGKARLLACALRCANDLCDTLGEPPKKYVVPAHSLAEYALLELYELVKADPSIAEKTGVPVRAEDYLALANFWIHGRGHHESRTNHPQYMGEYAQDHAPIEHQVQAVGHAVRAVLYYTGATRLAIAQNDEELLGHCDRLWKNVAERKLYINGGVGATHFEEKFGEDYDLQNGGYMETCATVGLMLWADAMSQAHGSGQYYDVIERALYNLMLSSVTMQGDAYFYRNPLCSKGDDHHWAWHTCPCCPPMIHKLFGQLPGMVYARSDDALFVNLYIAGAAQDGAFAWHAEGDCAREGNYRLVIDAAPDVPTSVKLRRPEWGRGGRVSINGQAVVPEIADGYWLLKRDWRAGDAIELAFDLPIVRVEAHPYVREDRGRVALMRGPIVYCLEGVDNNGEVDFTLPARAAFTARRDEGLFNGVYRLEGKSEDGRAVCAVPLYIWDNRRAGAMAVWLKQAGKPDGWETEGWENRLYREYRD